MTFQAKFIYIDVRARMQGEGSEKEKYLYFWVFPGEEHILFHLKA